MNTQQAINLAISTDSIVSFEPDETNEQISNGIKSGSIDLKDCKLFRKSKSDKQAKCWPPSQKEFLNSIFPDLNW